MSTTDKKTKTKNQTNCSKYDLEFLDNHEEILKRVERYNMNDIAMTDHTLHRLCCSENIEEHPEDLSSVFGVYELFKRSMKTQMTYTPQNITEILKDDLNKSMVNVSQSFVFVVDSLGYQFYQNGSINCYVRKQQRRSVSVTRKTKMCFGIVGFCSDGEMIPPFVLLPNENLVENDETIQMNEMNKINQMNQSKELNENDSINKIDENEMNEKQNENDTIDKNNINDKNDRINKNDTINKLNKNDKIVIEFSQVNYLLKRHFQFWIEEIFIPFVQNKMKQENYKGRCLMITNNLTYSMIPNADDLLDKFGIDVYTTPSSYYDINEPSLVIASEFVEMKTQKCSSQEKSKFCKNILTENNMNEFVDFAKMKKELIKESFKKAFVVKKQSEEKDLNEMKTEESKQKETLSKKSFIEIDDSEDEEEEEELLSSNQNNEEKESKENENQQFKQPIIKQELEDTDEEEIKKDLLNFKSPQLNENSQKSNQTKQSNEKRKSEENKSTKPPKQMKTHDEKNSKKSKKQKPKMTKIQTIDVKKIDENITQLLELATQANDKQTIISQQQSKRSKSISKLSQKKQKEIEYESESEEEELKKFITYETQRKKDSEKTIQKEEINKNPHESLQQEINEIISKLTKTVDGIPPSLLMCVSTYNPPPYRTSHGRTTRTGRQRVSEEMKNEYEETKANCAFGITCDGKRIKPLCCSKELVRKQLQLLFPENVVLKDTISGYIEKEAFIKWMNENVIQFLIEERRMTGNTNQRIVIVMNEYCQQFINEKQYKQQLIKFMFIPQKYSESILPLQNLFDVIDEETINYSNIVESTCFSTLNAYFNQFKSKSQNSFSQFAISNNSNNMIEYNNLNEINTSIDSKQINENKENITNNDQSLKQIEDEFDSQKIIQQLFIDFGFNEMFMLGDETEITKMKQRIFSEMILFEEPIRIEVNDNCDAIEVFDLNTTDLNKREKRIVCRTIITDHFKSIKKASLQLYYFHLQFPKIVSYLYPLFSDLTIPQRKCLRMFDEN